LGTEPRTEHPFNLYTDILSIPKALKRTLKAIPDQVGEVAGRIVGEKRTRIIGTGMGTSQFVASGAAGACGISPGGTRIR
jgi:fructoselysine-6-P-deglycase FrlB-like protein